MSASRPITPEQRAHLRAIARRGAEVWNAKRAAERRALGAPEELARFRGRPIEFLTTLVNPETRQPFALYPAQVTFLRMAFEGGARYPELVFSAPKKSGKTTLAALVLLYVVRVEAGEFAEGYAVANDLEQATGRVFRAAARIVRANPMLYTKPLRDRLEWPAAGATIDAISSDFASAAGSNHNIVVFDELWAFTSERSRRLWDELVPVPTRQPSVRLTTTYAGFEGESELLEGLHKQGLQGREIAPALYAQPGMLMFWSHEPVAPWQTEAWLGQMRAQLRPNAFVRMIGNQFVSSESGFVDLAWWDRCTTPTLRPVVADPSLAVWVGVDASVKRDSTAIVVVTWDADAKKVRLVWHRILRPRPQDPIDFEYDVELTLRELRGRFAVQAIRYDPYQMQASSQRLTRDGAPMQEFPQTLDRLTVMGSNLYELVKGGNLEVYPDDDIRRAIASAIAKETPRGWRIAKEKASQKIDVVVALAMAALAATEGQVQQVTALALPALLRAPAVSTREAWDPDLHYHHPGG